MGYYSSVHGEWTITPPLNGREIRAIPNVECVRVRVVETDRDTDEGVLTIKQGVAVEDAIQDSAKYYDLESHLRQVLLAIPKDREVTGEIVRVGEENGDVERYLPDVATGRVRTEQARLTWPDGTEVKY